MARHFEPNGSYYSARYAERKQAQRRARDAQPRQPEPCRYCCALIPVIAGCLYCDACERERIRVGTEQGISAMNDWQRNGPYARKLRGEP